MRRSTIYLIPILLLILVGLLVTSFSGFSLPSANTSNSAEIAAVKPLGTTNQLSEAGNLVCSDDCRSQGQCGETVTEAPTTVVLTRSDRPATDLHDIFVQANQPVTILESRLTGVNHRITGEPSQLYFYRVRLDTVQGQPEAWVAGWCIQEP